MRRLIFCFLLTAYCLQSPAQVNIWEGVAHHKSVVMTPYLADNSPLTTQNGIAVIVCPGGSFFWLDKENEGHEVGRWLQQNGITAFVLNYRTANVPAFITHYRLLFRGNRYPDAQDDLRQALRYVKAHADDYHIDTCRVGAMGFSAGGHLVMSAVELFEKKDRPAFVAPIYPVVTMEAPCVHKRSRRGLLGDSRTRNMELRDLLSLEKHVPEDCPPVFLVNCLDDPIVDYRNSELLDSALTAKGIPHQYHQFKTGGHGFGVSSRKGSDESRQWMALFLDWLNILIIQN